MGWTDQDVVNPGQRPGSYTNFIEAATAFISGGVTGVVAAVVTAAWGKEGEAVEIRNTEDIRKYFTNIESNFIGVAQASQTVSNRYSAPYILRNLLAGGAQRIIAYRVVGPNPVKSLLSFTE